MTDVDLWAIIRILTKKRRPFSVGLCFSTALFLKTMVMLTLRCQLVWSWGGREGKGGAHMAHVQGTPGKPQPCSPSPAGCCLLPKWREKQLLVLGKELQANPKKAHSKFPTTEQKLVDFRSHWLHLSGLTGQHCWKEPFITLLSFSQCQVLPSLDSIPGILLLCITWMYWPNIPHR